MGVEVSRPRNFRPILLQIIARVVTSLVFGRRFHKRLRGPVIIGPIELPKVVLGVVHALPESRLATGGSGGTFALTNREARQPHASGSGKPGGSVCMGHRGAGSLTHTLVVIHHEHLPAGLAGLATQPKGGRGGSRRRKNIIVTRGYGGAGWANYARNRHRIGGALIAAAAAAAVPLMVPLLWLLLLLLSLPLLGARHFGLADTNSYI